MAPTEIFLRVASVVSDGLEKASHLLGTATTYAAGGPVPVYNAEEQDALLTKSAERAGVVPPEIQ